MTDWTTGLLLCSIWKWTKVFDGSDRPGISYSCSKHALLSDTFLAVRLLSAVRPQRQTSELTGKSGRMWGHKSAQDEHVHSELEEKRARNFKQWMGGGLKPLHCCNICDWWDWSGSQDIQQITRDLHDPPALPTVMVRLLDGSAVWLLGPSALPLAVRWVSCVFWPLMVNGITSTSARPSGARLPGLITITQQAHPRPLYTLTFPAHWFATHTHTHTGLYMNALHKHKQRTAASMGENRQAFGRGRLVHYSRIVQERGGSCTGSCRQGHTCTLPVVS